MLNIRINSEPVDLANDQGFELVSANPVVDKDRINRAFSFPFILPASPRNLRVRNHVHRLDAHKPRSHDIGIVEFGGHQLLTGEVKTSQTSQEAEEAFIQNIPLDVWEKMKEFKISEILETIDIDDDGPPLARWWLVLDAPPNLYQIYIAGTAIIYDSLPGDDTFDCVNALTALINAEWPGMATAQATATILLDSEMMNEFELDTALTNFATLTDVVTIGERALGNMLAHVEEVYATPAASHCFPVIRWHDLYPSGENTIFSNWANMCIDGDAFLNVKDLEKRWYNTYIPMVRVPYILEKIGERIGATGWIGTVFDSEAIQQLIVVSNYCLDRLYYDRYDDAEFYYMNGFEQSWSLNDCVPQMNAADFVREICKLYALGLDYGDGSLSFSKSKVKVDNPPINLNKKASSKYRRAKNSANGWILKYQDSELEKYTDPAQLTTVSTGDAEVKNEIARTFFMTSDYAVSIGGDLKTPITQQAGAARVFSSGASRSSLPLTFLLERGPQPGELGTEYIYATHDTTDYDGVEIADFALSIEGDKGLISVWHAGIVEYSDADVLSITAALSIGDIQKIMQWKKARVTFYHPLGQVTGLLKNIKAKISGNVMEPVQIEILTKRS